MVSWIGGDYVDDLANLVRDVFSGFNHWLQLPRPSINEFQVSLPGACHVKGKCADPSDAHCPASVFILSKASAGGHHYAAEACLFNKCLGCLPYVACCGVLAQKDLKLLSDNYFNWGVILDLVIVGEVHCHYLSVCQTDQTCC